MKNPNDRTKLAQPVTLEGLDLGEDLVPRSKVLANILQGLGQDLKHDLGQYLHQDLAHLDQDLGQDDDEAQDLGKDHSHDRD